MPAPGQTVAAGEPAQILKLLADHPDTGYRPAEVARIIYPDMPKSAATMRAGTQLARLARTGRVSRDQQSVPDRKVPITTYSHKPTT